jgi:hypothetical protein
MRLLVVLGVIVGLGIAAARAGKRTVVCEVSAQENASRIFGRAEIGFHEVELQDGLWAISIDPDRSMREYLELQLPVKAMSDLLYRSRIFTYLAAATPGLRELVTIGKIWELALEDRKVRLDERFPVETAAVLEGAPPPPLPLIRRVQVVGWVLVVLSWVALVLRVFAALPERERRNGGFSAEHRRARLVGPCPKKSCIAAISQIPVCSAPAGSFRRGARGV